MNQRADGLPDDGEQAGSDGLHSGVEHHGPRHADTRPAGEAGADLGAALRDHCLAHLEPYKVPRRVLVVAGLPRTHLGKVDRSALRRQGGDVLAAAGP